MNNRNSLRNRGFVLRLASTAGLTALAITLAVPAHAQDATAAATAADAPEEIVITGSRIARPDLEAASPVQVLGTAQIEQSGVTNIQDVLLENPAFGVGDLSRTNSAFLTSGTGVATVDLRDLGSDRTLVLINGRRVVAGLPGSATVDLNVIPTQFLERVDVLTGGASSVYGSDAVAGVVNFIYKEDFEGIEFEGQAGITERGDDEQYRTSVTAGGNFADDRANVMVHVGYSKQYGVLSRERKNTAVDDSDTFALTGDPADFGVPTIPFLSSFPLQGRFDVAGTAGVGDDYTFDLATGQLRPCFSTNGGAAPASCGLAAGTQIGPDGYNRQEKRTIAVPVERFLFASRGHYDLTDSVRFISEATYAKTTSEREIEPFGLDSVNISPATGGRIAIESLVNGTPVLNPIVPAAIAAAARDTNGDGLRDIAFARRLGEVGSRSGDTTRDFFRIATGLQGSFLEERFRWDATYVYGQTTESQRSNGQVNVQNFLNALTGIPDVNDLNNNGSSTDVVCADANARSQGCVPINIFGNGSISPQALQYVNAEGSFQTDIKQHVVSANVSGDLFELPAGPLGFALGGEYREESSSEDNDALTNAGLNGGNALPDTAGKFNVKELYGELRVPVVSDKPFLRELSVGASGRISDYSTVGNVYSYSGNAEWAPVDDVRFRATYSRSVRAPNIGELFTGPSQTFPSGIVDPCIGVGSTGGGTRGDVCRAAPGVLANIAANGTFAVTQSDRQGISGFNSGNPDLDEEKSDSYTLGVVINPRSIEALRGVSLTVDYFNIDVQDAIVAAPRNFTLDQCYNQNNPQFCSLIVRRPTVTGSNSAGSLEFVNAPQVNGGKWKTDGIDVVAAYTRDLDMLGQDARLNARIAYSHYFTGYIVPVPGADKDPYVGEIGNPENKWTANLGANIGKFDVNFTGTYLGKSYEDDGLLAAYDLEPRSIGVDAEFYLDTQVRYNATEQAELYFGIDNLFDNDAPNLLSNTTFNTTGTDTAADVYDVFGRRFYVGARVRF